MNPRGSLVIVFRVMSVYRVNRGMTRRNLIESFVLTRNDIDRKIIHQILH